MEKISIIYFLALCFTFVKTDVSSAYGPPIQSSYGLPLQTYNPPSQSYGPPSNSYEKEEPQSYEFGYRVKDDYSGSNYDQREESDGHQVRGEYRVALPDGRTQIVTYWADWKTGFHADVKYEGEATYPQAKPIYGPPSTGGGYNYATPSSQYGLPH
ncbi:hypothetical protein ABEB36_007510 [Hypothenemus hampei]|uniref:Uncharacterized protein n=1 Tax=Hypothenemus hampei TaxID=57062 RepID=A0ABD1EV69_HYPHA